MLLHSELGVRSTIAGGTTALDIEQDGKNRSKGKAQKAKGKSSRAMNRYEYEQNRWGVEWRDKESLKSGYWTTADE